MGGAVSTGEDNDDLIDNLIGAEYIKTPSVERLFRSIDRADYFTDDHKDSAYKDLAWKDGNLHISAPCIYSEVMERLKLRKGLSFLNLGSGTGYFSTMVGLALGSNGINHGIEIHPEVVEYAKYRLEQFQKTSPAIDQYDFCPPEYVVGNCLSLPPDTRRYDRIYCGAGCPDGQENYFKNLIKVGGILVMPVNDQLLQIQRVDETKWENKTVLSVSFAYMIMPAENSSHVTLAQIQPLKLQDVCRTVIRNLLRNNVEISHPKLKSTSYRGNKRKAKKRPISRVEFPLIEQFQDDDDEEEEDESECEDEQRKSTTSSSLSEEEEESSRIPQLASCVSLELARALDRRRRRQAHTAMLRVLRRVVPPSELLEDPKEAETVPNEAEEERETRKGTRETADSGLGDEIMDKTGIDKVLDSDSDFGEELTDFDRDSKEDSSGKDEVKMDSEDGESSRPQRSGAKSRKTRKLTSLVFKKLACDDESEQEEPEINVAEAYSMHLKRMIHQLPLPPTLQSYLNYYRPF